MKKNFENYLKEFLNTKNIEAGRTNYGKKQVTRVYNILDDSLKDHVDSLMDIQVPLEYNAELNKIKVVLPAGTDFPKWEREFLKDWTPKSEDPFEKMLSNLKVGVNIVPGMGMGFCSSEEDLEKMKDFLRSIRM